MHNSYKEPNKYSIELGKKKLNEKVFKLNFAVHKWLYQKKKNCKTLLNVCSVHMFVCANNHGEHEVEKENYIEMHSQQGAKLMRRSEKYLVAFANKMTQLKDLSGCLHILAPVHCTIRGICQFS